MKVEAGAFKNYSYLIWDNFTGEAALIDPAWQEEIIKGRIESQGLSLKSILLTHSHYDHVNLVEYFQKRYNTEVFMHRKEIEFYDYRCGRLNSFEDGESILLGTKEITVLHTPGHTAGGSCFIWEDSLFTGDTIFIEGCGICHTRGGSPYEMYESIQRVKGEISKKTKIFPGHSFGKKVGMSLDEVWKNNIYFNLENVREFVGFRMRNNQKSTAVFS